MAKDTDEQAKLDNQSTGGHLSGTKYGNNPGDATTKGSQPNGGEGDSKKAKSG